MNDQLVVADVYDSFCRARERRPNLFPRRTVTPQLVFEELQRCNINTWDDIRLSRRDANRLGLAAREVLGEMVRELR